MNHKIIVAVLLLAVAVGACHPFADSADSHIQPSVPDEVNFAAYLKRDLQQYFKETKKKDVVVQYELLRKGPTESETGFPKFYAWVVLKADGTVIEEGAVKVAAVEKNRFGVNDYLSKSDIERDYDNLYRVFPTFVADTITEKAVGARLANRPRDVLWSHSTAPYMQTSNFKQAHKNLESEFWFSFTPDEREALLAQDKQTILRTIMAEKEYSPVSDARFWCAKNAPDVIPELIKLITDARVIGLQNTADLIIPERIDSGDLKFYGHGGVVADDLFSIAGRASWLLREITGQDFGSVSIKSTPEQLQQLSDKWRTWYEKNRFQQK